MKIPHFLLSILLCAACPQSQAEPAKSQDNPISKLHANDIQDLRIGDAAPDFKLLGIDDKRHTLGDYRAAKVLMVAFISNHCPDSHAAEARIKKLIRDMPAGQFSLVAINPNSPDGLSIDELGFSKYNDGFDDMKKYAADEGFNFPYLYDGETQAIAKAYGCLATPHVFVFDAERKLRYKGQFDDSRFADEATVTSQDARHAVEALLAGKPVPVEITKPHGCSTKWLDKKDLVSKKMEKWDKTPVDVELIDAAGVARLRKNGTSKMRLFNVWSTTCAPCVAEFPELVTTARKFGLRDFELIMISTDGPKDSAKVKAFLEKRGAGLLDRLKPSLKAEGRTTNSYIFKEADTNALMKALDPEWPGAIPHTVLVGTNGEILWRHNSAVNGEELRTVILEKMGRFYRP